MPGEVLAFQPERNFNHAAVFFLQRVDGREITRQFLREHPDAPADRRAEPRPGGVVRKAEDRKALFNGALKICLVRHVFRVSAAEGVRMIIDRHGIPFCTICAKPTNCN